MDTQDIVKFYLVFQPLITGTIMVLMGRHIHKLNHRLTIEKSWNKQYDEEITELKRVNEKLLWRCKELRAWVEREQDKYCELWDEMYPSNEEESSEEETSSDEE